MNTVVGVHARSPSTESLPLESRLVSTISVASARIHRCVVMGPLRNDDVIEHGPSHPANSDASTAATASLCIAPD